MLTYLTESVRPDIDSVIHQYAWFRTHPMSSYEQAIIYIGWHFLATKDWGMIYKPDPKKGLEVYVDAYFAGEWDPSLAHDADTVYSRTGFVIFMPDVQSYGQNKFKRR